MSFPFQFFPSELSYRNKFLILFYMVRHKQSFVFEVVSQYWNKNWWLLELIVRCSVWHLFEKMLSWIVIGCTRSKWWLGHKLVSPCCTKMEPKMKFMNIKIQQQIHTGTTNLDRMVKILNRHILCDDSELYKSCYQLILVQFCERMTNNILVMIGI